MTVQHEVELVVRTIAQTAIDNERYFGDLDAVVGGGGLRAAPRGPRPGAVRPDLTARPTR